MKKTFTLVLAGLVTVALAAGCKDKAPQASANAQPGQPAMQGGAPAAGKTGTVVETMNSAGYTYVQVDTGKEKIWAAAPEFQVKVGDPVVVPEGMPMTNYHSKTLNRDFDLVYFVDSVLVGGASAAAGGAMPGAKMPEGHPPVNQGVEAKGVDFSGLKKADGGKTVQEVFAGKSELAGKEVTLRGKVVKFSPEIMGKNWIHLQDGTGADGTNDITITTSNTAKVGDTVLVTGKVTADKDFGYGYKYALIVEDAKVVVE